MGPRIYPSQQDTNTTAKGSLLLSEDENIAVIDVYVNNVLAAKEYSTVEGLYVVGLNIGDVVRLEASSNFNIIAKRYNYTTDYENGDNGVKVTELGTTVGISAYTFTVTTLVNSYNFEYYLDTSPFFINLVYSYSGITDPDGLYTVATVNQTVTLDGRQFNIPSASYSSDTGFIYNIGQIFITGGTSQIFRTRTTLSYVGGGNCVRWQSGFLGVYKDDIEQGGSTGTFPVSTPACNSSKVFELDSPTPITLVQNGTYEVRRRDRSVNIAPTPTPSPTAIVPTPTPTPTPIPTPQTGITFNNLAIYVNGSPASYPGTGTTWTNIETDIFTKYNGTLIGNPVWSGGTAPFFTFDGVDDAVDFAAGSVTGVTTTQSFGGWVKTTTSSTDKTFYSRGRQNNYSLQLLKNTSNNFYASVQLTNPINITYGVTSTTTLVNDIWYYVMVVFQNPGGTGQAGSMKIYINGILEATTSWTTNRTLKTDVFGWNYARNNNLTTLYADCGIAEGQLYFGSLSASQILSNFEGSKEKYGY